MRDWKEIGRKFLFPPIWLIMILTVNLALSGAVLMMVYFDRGFQYQGFLIYVIALYTFYITTIAIIDMVKYPKYKQWY